MTKCQCMTSYKWHFVGKKETTILIAYSENQDLKMTYIYVTDEDVSHAQLSFQTSGYLNMWPTYREVQIHLTYIFHSPLFLSLSLLFCNRLLLDSVNPVIALQRFCEKANLRMMMMMTISRLYDINMLQNYLFHLRRLFCPPSPSFGRYERLKVHTQQRHTKRQSMMYGNTFPYSLQFFFSQFAQRTLAHVWKWCHDTSINDM